MESARPAVMREEKKKRRTKYVHSVAAGALCRVLGTALAVVSSCTRRDCSFSWEMSVEVLVMWTEVLKDPPSRVVMDCSDMEAYSSTERTSLLHVAV